MLKYGWIGYQFNPQNRIEVGLTRVPFGIQPSGAHNFFFQIAYYVGLEDDSDMGVKFVHTGEHWEYALAFSKMQKNCCSVPMPKYLTIATDMTLPDETRKSTN